MTTLDSPLLPRFSDYSVCFPTKRATPDNDEPRLLDNFGSGTPRSFLFRLFGSFIRIYPTILLQIVCVCRLILTNHVK